MKCSCRGARLVGSCHWSSARCFRPRRSDRINLRDAREPSNFRNFSSSPQLACLFLFFLFLLFCFFFFCRRVIYFFWAVTLLHDLFYFPFSLLPSSPFPLSQRWFDYTTLRRNTQQRRRLRTAILFFFFHPTPNPNPRRSRKNQDFFTCCSLWDLSTFFIFSSFLLPPNPPFFLLSTAREISELIKSFESKCKKLFQSSVKLKFICILWYDSSRDVL